MYPDRTKQTISPEGDVEEIEVLEAGECEEGEDVYDFSVPKHHAFFTEEALVSNCSEFLGMPNSACNLASINLAAFYDRDGGFKEEEFDAAVRLSVISQDILVEMCGYPTEEITKNSRANRPLGLGFSNLGGLFLKMGIPYDSDLARAWASAITSRMTAKAFITSSELARMQGTFTGFEENKRGMLAILKQHKTKFAGVMEQSGTLLPGLDKVEDLWEQAYADAAKYGVRNSAVTLVPPAGTISYLMDCTTQGIEPMLFLMGKKALVGGGELVFLNPVVENTLQYLGYSAPERAILTDYIKANGKLDGSPIRPQHLAIFDPVYPASVGDRHISIQGQMLMMAAVQPFISGAISKTFGLPRNSSVQEVKDIIVQAWKLGLKAVTVYRDGSKINQRMTSAVAGKILLDDDEVRRDRLPDDTNAKKHRVVIRDLTGETKMYILPSFYSDGRLGEAFISGLGKEGSSLKGLVEALMTSVSIALQYGVPLEVFAEKFIGTIFSPRGLTSNPKIPSCTSLIDYIFRYLMNEYGNEDSPEASLTPSEKAKTALIEHRIGKAVNHSGEILTGEMCKCGSLMVRNGAGCKSCLNPSCPNFASSSCGG